MEASRSTLANGGYSGEESRQRQQLDQRPSTVYAPIAPAITSVGRSNSEATRDARPHKQRRIACRHCRQAKLRCEGSEGGTRLCSRCDELSLECVVDLDYKRVSKRTKLSELTEQVEQLRSAAQSNQTAQSTTAAANTAPSPASSTSIHATDQLSRSRRLATRSSGLETARQNDVVARHIEDLHSSADQPAPDPRISDTFYSFSATTPRSLENIFLSPEQIGHLFQVYFEHYHPFFAILDPAVLPEDVYEHSGLLFWTIIVIAAQHDQDDFALLAALIPCVKTLLWSNISAPPHSLFSVQAMSLICMWPFPTSSMSTDISFILAGILKTAAIHIGLHRPEILQDYSRVKCQLGPQELREAVKAWAGCYIAAESVTASIGQLSFFASDLTIERACGPDNPYDLSRDLYHFLLIQRFCNRVHRAMGGNDHSLTGHPAEGEGAVLMKLHEQDFEDLKKQIGDTLALRTEILLLCACLQFRIYYLFDNSISDSRKHGLIKAFVTALTLISKVETASASSNLIKYAPFLFMHFCWIAAILVMKVVNSSYFRYVDVQGGKRAFNAVISMSRLCCVEDNDLMGRMTKILAQLWNMHHSLGLERKQEPGLEIKSRYYASIIHDSLWFWRERYGGQSGNGAPPLPLAIVSPSPPVALTAVPRTGFSSTPLPSTPPRSFDPPSGAAGQPPSQVGSTSHLTYASNTLEPGFLPSNFDVTREEQDWMWHVGFPSLIPVDLDFHSTSSGLGFVHQDQMQQ